MAQIRKNLKKGGLAEKIERRTNLTMKKFAELNALSYLSLKKGYLSAKSEKVLARYGIRPSVESERAKSGVGDAAVSA
ncbi:hypothetical protein [uncultured Campylobacter sp.]|jgi:hypothetical protein|uniref:hypothetical protein n=1 Tax=uncultured Campylobacter sp. TaxID=218934 RepID=UPI002626CD07|nr:hypothetical protein [uncultured Campylobacter sp.]